MDDESFDPRSWAKPAVPAAKPAAESAPAPAGPETGSSLPEAWRDIGVITPPKVGAGAAVAKPAGPKQAPPPVMLWGVSLALLAATGLGAWLTRSPPAERPEAAAAAEIPAPAAVPGAVERALVLAGPADLAGALVAAGVSQQEAQAAVQAAASVLTSQAEVHAIISLLPQGGAYSLQGLKVSYADGSGAVIARSDAGGFAASPVAAELTKQVKVLRGELDSESFYTSAVSAGVLDTLIPEFINAFSFDFNLASEVSPGDTFEVAYEQNVNPSGDAVGQPQLLYASLTTPVKSLGLYRFKLPDGTVGWYDGNGASTKRGLMRTPVDGARITSNFGMRFHPVLHYNRLHAGVDFGVPVGTPVYAAAAGVVTGATPTGCGGNMVVIQHDNGWVTRYFHLSHYADGLHGGQRVTQGYTVGLSGTTGTCTTGPHLHYELRINGEPVDPLSVKTDDSERKKIEGGAMDAFKRQRDRVDVARAQQAM